MQAFFFLVWFGVNTFLYYLSFMKISLEWIQRYTDLLETHPEKIAEVLTEKSAEVEEVHLQGKTLEKVILGEIQSITPHPDADKLNITQTKISNTETVQIVCGAGNIYEGMKVPVALVGAVLPGDFAIKKAKVRGIESNGMLCSGKELGIGEDHTGILDCTKKDFPLGTPFAEVIDQNDIIFEIENTSITNRADLFSHYGFAREFIACGLATPKQGQSFLGESKGFESLSVSSAKLPIDISFPEHPEEILKAYSVVSVSGVDGSVPSPQWMQKCLKSVGIEPKNALVDITNFVMFEMGIPLHAFDSTRSPNSWRFTLTQGGEEFVNLDGDQKKLPSNAIALDDGKGKIFDLCGIQGGQNSGIIDSTKDVILHAPVYDPVKIRRTSIAVDHRTDASIIYEKSVPPELSRKGIERALVLLHEIFPQSSISSAIQEYSFQTHTPSVLSIPLSFITQKLGIEITLSKVIQILDTLGFITKKNKEEPETLEISVPYFREGDITLPEDITEEIARIIGLNTIPAVAPSFTLMEQPLLPKKRVENNIIQTLCSHGAYECITLAFYGNHLLKRMGMPTQNENHILLENPLSEDLEIMRTSLSPRLFETAELNRKYKESFRIFESGKVFRWENGEKKEEHRITALLVGDDFFTAKSIAEDIFASFSFSARMQKKEYPLSFAHPGRGAEMIAGKNASIKVFQIHPRTAKEFGLPEKSSIVCVQTEAFESLLGKVPRILELPRFPGISFDFSVLCAEKITAEALLKNISKIDSHIVRAEVESVWRGEGVEKGQKSVTLSFEFRSAEKTLKDSEAKAIEKKVIEELKKRGAEPRF